jgi:hypothetical protein
MNNAPFRHHPCAVSGLQNLQNCVAAAAQWSAGPRIRITGRREAQTLYGAYISATLQVLQA